MYLSTTLKPLRYPTTTDVTMLTPPTHMECLLIWCLRWSLRRIYPTEMKSERRVRDEHQKSERIYPSEMKSEVKSETDTQLRWSPRWVWDEVCDQSRRNWYNTLDKFFLENTSSQIFSQPSGRVQMFLSQAGLLPTQNRAGGTSWHLQSSSSPFTMIYDLTTNLLRQTYYYCAHKT